MRLLEIIRSDKPLGKENQVSLDWFPNFHIGPKPVPGGTNYTGSYGVTWDNATFDTRIAVWKLVKDIIPQARKQNVNFQGPQTAFKQWLDKSPLWRVKETLKAILKPYPLEEMVAWVDYPQLEAKVHRIHERNIPNMPQGREW